MKAKIIRLDIQQSQQAQPISERFDSIWDAIARANELKALPGTSVSIVIDPPRKPAVAG